MSLFDRFSTYTIKPQSHQKSSGFGLCFKSRLTDIHETSGKTWAKFRARLRRILLSCGTCVKLSGFGWVSPWASHSNNPKFQSKIKGWRETSKPHNNDKAEKEDLLENGTAIIFQTISSWCPWIPQIPCIAFSNTIALSYAKSRLPTSKGKKVLDPQRSQEAVKHLLKITGRFKMLTVCRNAIINICLRMQIWEGRGSN